MKRFRVWKSAAAHPKFLVITDRIHYQRILLPVADGAAVITRHGFVRLAQRTASRVDHPPVAISPSQQDENAAQFLLLDELKSVWRLKLTRPAWRKASVDGIVFQE